MKKWKEESLEQVNLEIIDGDRGDNYPKSHEFTKEGHCLFLNTSNIKDDSFQLSDIHFIDEKKDSMLRKGKLQRNDIVITTRGTIGSIAYYHNSIPYDHIRINSGMVIIRSQNNVDSKYLYLAFRSNYFKEQCFKRSSGSAQPQLPIKDLKTIKIPLPPLPTQQRIAAILSAYDDLIENNRRRITLLENSARLLYKEWFVKFQFPGHEKVKVKNGLPEEWERKKIGDIAETVGGGTPSTVVPEYWNEGNITWFVPKDLTNNGCLPLIDSEKKITSLGLKKSSARMLPPETILMTSRASIGYFGLFEKECCTNQGFISIIPKLENSKMFILYNLMNRKQEIELKASGTTFKEISKGIFRQMEMFIPNKVLVEEFEIRVYTIFKQVRSLKKQTQKLREARNILLPKLMNQTIEV